MCYKQYSEMTEALAERLLDLHCRLLPLYIIQDADCLHWEDQQTFFESERGSETIQMWWAYMQVKSFSHNK
jgi:protein KIAA0825